MKKVTERKGKILYRTYGKNLNGLWFHQTPINGIHVQPELLGDDKELWNLEGKEVIIKTVTTIEEIENGREAGKINKSMNRSISHESRDGYDYMNKEE